jgi:hypothetical protein
MPKKTKKKPHVYKVGQRAEFQVTLTGKVQSIVPKAKGLVVTKVFPIKGANLKKPKAKMLAGRKGSGSVPIGPIASPDACEGNCVDSVSYQGRTLNFYKCKAYRTGSTITVICRYR